MTEKEAEVDLISLVEPLPLSIPDSSSTVDVYLIDTTASRIEKASNLFSPAVRGFETLTFPSHSFLISHTVDGECENLLFDLSIRKDWETGFPPVFTPLVSPQPGANAPTFNLSVSSDVPAILSADTVLSLSPSSISAVIWSHHHFDHIGDISLFPSTTQLVIGPDLLSAYATELYPTNAEGELAESNFKGRDIRKLADADFTLTINDFHAHDYFGDGSLYLLSAPGHTAGHLAALARVTTNPSTFVLLAGDSAHHPGVFRPSPYSPLPQCIDLKTRSGSKSYSGERIASLLQPQGRMDKPFLLPDEEPMCHDTRETAETVAKLQIFDAFEHILVCIAHDNTLLDTMPPFPNALNGWKASEVKQKLHWAFLKSFDLRGCEQ